MKTLSVLPWFVVLLVLVTQAPVAHAETRVLLRDRFEPGTALDEMTTQGGSLGVRASIALDDLRFLDGETALVMGGVARELRVTHAFRDPGDALGASVYVYVDDGETSDAMIEVDFDEGDPIRVGIDGGGQLLLEAPGAGSVPRVNFEPGWSEITLHREDGRLRVFVSQVAVVQWDDDRAWSSVSLVREGPADTWAWFDDFRLSTGPPQFIVRAAKDDSRRARLPHVGVRAGVASILDPSSADPGVNLALEYSLNVRPRLRIGFQGGLQVGSWLGDGAALDDFWIVGGLIDYEIGTNGFFLRGEAGITWYGASIGIPFDVLPRLALAPSIGIRHVDEGSGILEIPIALTMRWANEVPGSRVSRRP